MAAPYEPDLTTDLLMKWAAVRACAREVGWVRGLWWLVTAQLGPNPFASLPPASDARERATRAQLGEALKVYRRLRAAMDPDAALGLVRAIVTEAGTVFLSRSIGRITPEGWRAMDDESRRAWVTEAGGRFPNAEVEIRELDADTFRFEVVHCRFVPLCAALGHPELVSAFCAADDAFFGEGDIALTRPTLQSQGDATCDFRFRVREAE